MIPNKAALENVITDLSSDDGCIIVEGKRDISALVALGIAKDRILQTAQIRYCDLEAKMRSGYKKLIPLFDNDRTGRNRLSSFMAYFSANGTPIDLSYSSRIKNSGLVCLEDIDNVVCS